MAKLKETEKLSIVSMGKKFPVTAIFDNDEDANAYMARHKDEGVIAVIQGFIFIASFYEGQRIRTV